jgi:gliding motility-associated-like protein
MMCLYKIPVPFSLLLVLFHFTAQPAQGESLPLSFTTDTIFNIGETPSTSECAGTLFDSGGPAGDYSSGENLTFTICPDEIHQCIFIDVQTFDLENDFDFLYFFAGENTGAPQIASLTGSGNSIQLQIHSACVTLQFQSDNTVADAGFALTWMCSPDTCTIPPPITCDNAVPIPALPYSASDLTTCNAGNNYTAGPCNNDVWMDTDDYIFTYESPGNECIAVSITGTNAATGIGIFNGCPSTATECIAQAGGGLGQADPMINAAYLEVPGTYYIVVDNAFACTPFDVQVQQVTCPAVFPSAALCGDALSLNGCGGLPTIVSVAPGQGDPGFIDEGVNNGCWNSFSPNFTFFTFQALAAGEFGFVLKAADPNESSDIDFQVWGPTSDPAALCDFAATHQPIRSSYAAGADPTGLANFHPLTGLTVTDTCETQAGDDFLKTIETEPGQFYLILINDWGNQIVSGAVSIDFSGTTPGVLDALPPDFTVSPDTVVCPGDTVQLFASGGELYQWLPEDGLSCVSCQNPVATVSAPSHYDVIIQSICVTDTLGTDIGFHKLEAGSDTTICTEETAQFNSTTTLANPTFQWTGPAGMLNCSDCPNPVFTGNAPGNFTFEITANSSGCTLNDEINLIVLQAPQYEISGDQTICFGETITLGGPPVTGVFYNWTSFPPGFVSNESNPGVTPFVTTTYYLEVSNGQCPHPVFDSVTIAVTELPVIEVASDTFICPGNAVLLGFNQPLPGVYYAWSSPGDPGFSSNDPAPVVSPNQTMSYILTIINGICPNLTDTVTVTVAESPVLTVSNDTTVCGSNGVTLTANASQPGDFTWQPGGVTGENFTPQLQEGVNSFTVTYSNECGDTLMETILVEVVPGILITALTYDSDSTTVFQGTPITLTIETDTPATGYVWSSGSMSDTAQVIPQTLPSATYSITVTGGLGCSDSASITFEVRESKFDIPNIFTPNNDGLNDFFLVIIAGDNIEAISTEVWNRWGQRVYEGKNNSGWDGSQNGKPAPSDVYVYRIVLKLPDGRFISKTGDVTLLR